MPKVAAKRKQGNGESEEERNSCRVRFPRSTVVAKIAGGATGCDARSRIAWSCVDSIVDRSVNSKAVVTSAQHGGGEIAGCAIVMDKDD